MEADSDDEGGTNYRVRDLETDVDYVEPQESPDYLYGEFFDELWNIGAGKEFYNGIYHRSKFDLTQEPKHKLWPIYVKEE